MISKKQIRSIHFITLGISQNHVFPILERYHPEQIVLISSRELEQQTSQLSTTISKKFEIPVDIEFLSPFQKNALQSMIQQLNQVVKDKCIQYNRKDVDFYTGITGGTNLMVLAAGIVALKYRMKIHYVLNPEFVHLENNDNQSLILEMDPTEFRDCLHIQDPWAGNNK